MGIDGLGSSATVEARPGLSDDFHDLGFSIAKSRRYHEKLAHFYGYWRDWTRIATILSGSGLFVLIFAGADKLAGVVSAVFALWAMTDFLVDPDKKARLHDELRQDFIRLAIKFEETPRTDEAIRELTADRLKIEAREPPCKRLVDLQARNDECRARGYPKLVPLNRWQNSLGYLFTFGMGRLERWKASQA